MKNSSALIFLTLALTAAACKKNDNQKVICKLAVVTPGEYGEVINIYYDNLNRLKTIKRSATTIDIEYKGDSLIATESSNGNLIQKNRCKLNANGLPVTVIQEIDMSTNLWLKHDYEYNGTELIKISTAPRGNTGAISGIFKWSNGNMIRSEKGSDIQEFEYHTDKPDQRANFWILDLFKADCGIEYIRNKNLVKKHIYVQPSARYAFFYEYEFDKEGKVTRILNSNDHSDLKKSWNMQYVCDL